MEKEPAIGLLSEMDNYIEPYLEEDTILDNYGDVFIKFGQYDKALYYYKKSLDVRLKSLGTEHPLLAYSYTKIGVVWFKKGEYDKALDFHKICLDIRVKTLGVEHPEVANSYNNVGVVCSMKREHDKSLVFLKSAWISN